MTNRNEAVTGTWLGSRCLSALLVLLIHPAFFIPGSSEDVHTGEPASRILCMKSGNF